MLNSGLLRNRRITAQWHRAPARRPDRSLRPVTVVSALRHQRKDLQNIGSIGAVGNPCSTSLWSCNLRTTLAMATAVRACTPAGSVTTTVRVAFWSDMSRSRSKLIVVGFVQELFNILRGFGLLEEAAKRVVAKLTRNVFQSPEVIAGPIGRGNQQKEQVSRFRRRGWRNRRLDG